MSQSIPLFNTTLDQGDLDSLFSSIRSTGFIAEVTSGEMPPEESGLWDTVLPVPPSSLPEGASTEALVDYAVDELDGNKWNSNAIVVADGKTSKDHSLLVVEVRKKKEKGQRIVHSLRVAPNSLIEVCSNLAVSNMSLQEVSVSGPSPKRGQ